MENCQTVVFMAYVTGRGRVPFAFLAGDEVHGRGRKLRAACERAGKGYVLAVPVTFRVTSRPGGGWPRRRWPAWCRPAPATTTTRPGSGQLPHEP